MKAFWDPCVGFLVHVQTTTNAAALNCIHLLAHHFVDHSCGHGITRFSIQSYEAKIKRFAGCVLIRSSGSCSKHTWLWQNYFPYGCRTEVPVSLLAVSWEPHSASRRNAHSKACIPFHLQSQQNTIKSYSSLKSLSLPIIQRASSAINRLLWLHQPTWTLPTFIVQGNIIVGMPAQHIHRLHPCSKWRGLLKGQRSSGGILSPLPTILDHSKPNKTMNATLEGLLKKNQLASYRRHRYTRTVKIPTSFKAIRISLFLFQILSILAYIHTHTFYFSELEPYQCI